MRRASGVALLWVLVLAGVSVALAAGALAVSRMTVVTSAAALSRADGLRFAEAAAEAVASHVRQNAGLRGALRPGAARVLWGDLPSVEVGARFEADLTGYDPDGPSGRSFLVRVWRDGEVLPFAALVTLRSDLTVAEWFVLDHAVSSWSPREQDLPTFASCAAVTPRVTSVGATPVSNTIRWSIASGTPAPDEVRVSWFDFRAGVQREVSVAGDAGEVAVSTPLVSSGTTRPQRVAYHLVAVFDGNVADECVAEVVSGRSFLDVAPLTVCAVGDTVRVTWDVNAASGVQLALTWGGGSSVESTASAGSLSIAVPSVSNPRVELRVPAGVGDGRTVSLTRVC